MQSFRRVRATHRRLSALVRFTHPTLVLLLLGGNFIPAAEIRLLDRDPAGHGLLCASQGKTILMVAGTPEQMGTAHGTLLKEPARKLTERVLYLVGSVDSLDSGVWALERMEEIQRRTLPHTPKRFLVECDAFSRAAGISQRDGRFANLFPERFHCTGVAVRGKASKDGRILHARVLDYMRDINLQRWATVTVFMPEGRNKWVTLGYAGFVGTVTAMNEKGLAVGEMGGRGEGDWDGMPMTFLLRDVMERASTVEEALEILRKTPRTCEYYYVFSDKTRNMAGVHCDPRQMTVLRPGEQHPRLPLVPEDTVMVSGEDRAKVLSERLQAHYGKIDVATLIEIIKRPVAMDSNLHDAIFTAETQEMWFADAGKQTVACDEPYAHFSLAELIGFYEKNAVKKAEEESAEAYGNRVQVTLRQLRTEYSKFPLFSDSEQEVDGESDDHEEQWIRTCKKTVVALLETADSPEKHRILSDAFTEALTESDRFRFFEYYIVWRAHRLICVAPPKDKKALFQLANKIDNRRKVAMPRDVRGELCAMTIELLLELVEYEDPAMFNPRKGEYWVNWTKWKAFRDWLDRNRERIVFDEKKKQFVVPTPE